MQHSDLWLFETQKNQASKSTQSKNTSIYVSIFLHFILNSPRNQNLLGTGLYTLKTDIHTQHGS